MKNETQLVKRLKEGNTSAMGELYVMYFDKVFQRCLSITKNEADAYDCANDALLISFEKITSFKENAAYSTWLYTIATNYSISYCKKASKDINPDIYYDEMYSAPRDFDVVPSVNMTTSLTQLLDVISSSDKELLIEKYSNRKSIEELQEQFGLGSSAIKMRLSRAKKKVNDLYFSQLALSA